MLGVEHSVTKALAKASITMAKVYLWKARLAIRTLRLDQREAIAEATENEDQSSLPPHGPQAPACVRVSWCAARVSRPHGPLAPHSGGAFFEGGRSDYLLSFT